MGFYTNEGPRPGLFLDDGAEFGGEWTSLTGQDIHSYLSVLDGPVCRSTRLLRLASLDLESMT